ncbi:RagB/SusD family nutrient uptake outer membrane protein [Pedobacter insulae]|uniref:SusD family protein n=1 Tax=Pedobacter insulae TaxID=414048 RepID=A0A1I3APA5_9SPHI|nr:RagB/SusD family nutrient uptake outer membrane protein [Pedobacter insulae]SFH51810.1 SusD family protein [Pedobacter insulae]
MKKSFLFSQVAKYFLFLISILFMTSCEKDWLEKKPDKSMVVPKSVADYQAILNYQTRLNYVYGLYPIYATDEFYTTRNGWNTRSDRERNTYIWASELNSDISEWVNMYQTVFYANAALNGLDQLSASEKNGDDWKNARGCGLFFRALSFYWLSQLFSAPYDAKTSETDLGIVLRLDPNPEKALGRASVKDTYDRILDDLTNANQLLYNVPAYPTTPSKWSSNALLSRIHLTMGNYEQALSFATASLALKDNLMNYNDVVPVSNFQTFQPFNEEVLLDAYTGSSGTFLPYATGASSVDTILYGSYSQNDLRKSLLYYPQGNRVIYRGEYSGRRFYPFTGLATNEVYLIKAECEARLGQTAAAMNTLNTLLKTRWRTGTFVPFLASSQREALNIILAERRKELVFTGLRWVDLRRLNKDPDYAVTLIRKFEDGEIFTLPPNDPRYVFPIPQAEIELTGIEQNVR